MSSHIIGNSVRRRALAFGLVFIALLVVGVTSSRAAEIIPSVGISRPVEGDADAKTYAGLAVRGALAPLLEAEIAGAYRSESRFDGNLEVRMWPITGSLYLTPVPYLYAGGGVGWYNTTFDYNSSLPIADETHQDFGVHLGGGVQVPLAPSAAIDLGGRYVMLREQDSHLVPEKFNPDFWTTSLGLAIRF